MSVIADEAKGQNEKVKCPSYLLVLDGSAEAMSAARFAWDAARATNARVTAQHVLDTPAAWGSLHFKLPGFVGSGVYVEAHKKITEALRSVAETIMLSYKTQAEGHDQATDNFIDEGEPIAEICRRALDHDLVIIGQLEGADMGNKRPLSDQLIDDCKKPIVIVELSQSEKADIKVTVGNKELNPRLVDELCAYAKSAKIEVEE